MAFLNKDGEKISYECSDLIRELQDDIEEFGGDRIVAVWCKDKMGVTLFTNYDFIDTEDPIKKSELLPGEYIRKMTMSTLMILLEKQNEIL